MSYTHQAKTPHHVTGQCDWHGCTDEPTTFQRLESMVGSFEAPLHVCPTHHHALNNGKAGAWQWWDRFSRRTQTKPQ